MMEYSDFALRLARLREKKGASARDMSLSMGQNAGYIHNIESGKSKPSITGFFYICEYLGIGPQHFFDTETISPSKAAEIMQEIGRLPPDKADHILQVIKDLANQ